MQRREVVRFLGAALALPFVPANAEAAIALGEQVHRRLGGKALQFRTLSAARQALVADIAEMIIPETDTPGAKTVKVPEFIDLILSEWASADETQTFLAGLDAIDARAAALVSADGRRVPQFVDLTPPQKTTLLTALDDARADRTGAGHAFGRIKALTVYGYFTSQPAQGEVLKTRMFFNGYQVVFHSLPPDACSHSRTTPLWSAPGSQAAGRRKS